VDTLAGDRASTSVPTVKTSPLINTTRRNNPPAGARTPCRTLLATAFHRLTLLASPTRWGFVHTSLLPPSMGASTDSDGPVHNRNLIDRRLRLGREGEMVRCWTLERPRPRSPRRKYIPAQVQGHCWPPRQPTM